MLCALTYSTSWLIAFLSQLNPLFGPELDVPVAGHVRKEWNGFGDTENSKFPCMLHHLSSAHVNACILNYMQVIQAGSQKDQTSYSQFSVCD